MKGRRNSERGTPGLFWAVFVAMAPVFLCDVWSEALRPSEAPRDAIHLPTAIGDYHYFPPDESFFQQATSCEIRGRRFNLFRRSDMPMAREDQQMVPLGWEMEERWRVYVQTPLPGPKDKTWPTLYGKFADGQYVELGERNHWPKKERPEG